MSDEPESPIPEEEPVSEAEQAVPTDTAPAEWPSITLPPASAIVEEILNQIQSAERDVLRAPSKNSDTERMLVGAMALMGVELAHSESIQQGILRWLPQLAASVQQLGESAEAARAPVMSAADLESAALQEAQETVERQVKARRDVERDYVELQAQHRELTEAHERLVEAVGSEQAARMGQDEEPPSGKKPPKP